MLDTTTEPWFRKKQVISVKVVAQQSPNKVFLPVDIVLFIFTSFPYDLLMPYDRIQFVYQIGAKVADSSAVSAPIVAASTRPTCKRVGFVVYLHMFKRVL